MVSRSERARRTGARAHVAAPRMPSTAGYMAVATIIAAFSFFVVGLSLNASEDEAPWLLAALAAGAVLLVAAATREVIMRRAWARYTREMEHAMGRGQSVALRSPGGKRRGATSGVHAAASALRKLQGRLAEADKAGALPETHLEAYRLCEQYLTNTEEAIRSSGGAADTRAALRAGQERVRALQKGHLLAWARGEATRLMQEAQRRVRMSDKIETAQRALAVIEDALRIYPNEPELHQSATAVRDLIASVKVGHWVEMAERAAFRGRYGRAIARYRDALFYLSRADMGSTARDEAARRIQREIELLRARVATDESVSDIAKTDFDLEIDGQVLDAEIVEASSDDEANENGGRKR